MNGINYVLDTNIITYYLQGKEDVYPFLNGTFIFISFITELELYADPALSMGQEKKLKQLLETFTIFEINPFIKEHTIVFKRDFKLKIPDAIIAATALYLGYPLVTADKAFKKLSIPIIYFSYQS